MTQPEPRRPEAPPSQGGGLTAKIGPLPAWGWLGLAVVGGVIVLLYLRSRNASNATAAPSSGISPDTATVQNLQDQLATFGSQVRDLQGAPSRPLGSNDRNSYVFKIANDTTGPAGAIYIGVPGVGYYWVPTPEVLTNYSNVKHPVDLGSISQSDANNRFGSLQPWSSIGQGPSQ